jgi:hypothetical protein
MFWGVYATLIDDTFGTLCDGSPHAYKSLCEWRAARAVNPEGASSRASVCVCLRFFLDVFVFGNVPHARKRALNACAAPRSRCRRALGSARRHHLQLHLEG